MIKFVLNKINRYRSLCALVTSILFANSTLSAENELLLITPHWEGVKTEFGQAFQKFYKLRTGKDLSVRWLDIGGTSDILRFVRSEFKNKPDGIGVDLFFGGGIEPYQALKKLGFLEPYQVPDSILSAIAATINGVPLYDPEFTWYAATMAGFGIMYNKVVLNYLGLPEPETWEDLAQPSLNTWVGSADPRKSGSVHMAYEIILQAYGWERGWEIIMGIGANVRGFKAYGAQIPKDVAAGEVAYGMTIDSYAWAQIDKLGKDKIGFIMPADLTVVNGDAIGILSGAPHPETARLFIDFVLSEAGQKLWILNQGEPDGPQQFVLGKFSVRPGLYAKIKGRTSVQMNPFEWKSTFIYNEKKGSARWSIINDLIGSFIIEPHQHLKKIRDKMKASGLPDSSIKKIFSIPVSEGTIQPFVKDNRWRDAAFRNQQLNKWSSQAREKYGTQSILTLLGRNIPAILSFILAIGIVLYLRRQRHNTIRPE